MNMSDNLVHIAVISDNGFMEASIVMLTSAKMNKNKESHYRIHFICNDVSRFYIGKLRELHEPDFEIVLYDAPKRAYFEDVNIKIHVTATTFLKLEIPEILQDVSKVIHIDGDVIVQGDLSHMYNIDLSGNVLGVTRSIRMEKAGMIQKRGIDKSFNAGIMLMNLDYMRKNRDSEKLIDMLRNIPEDWNLLEQDCLNVYYLNKCLYLPIRYNCFYFTMIKSFSIDEVNSFYGTSYESYDELVSDALLIHLAGTPGMRPWQVSNGVHGSTWQHYYDISPLKHIYRNRPDSISTSIKKELDVAKQELAELKQVLSSIVFAERYTKIWWRYRLYQLKSYITWGGYRAKYASKKRDLKTLLRMARTTRKEGLRTLFSYFCKY